MRQTLRARRWAQSPPIEAAERTGRTSSRQRRGPWLFRSFDDLHHDLVNWLPRLPKIAAVCGVPRSGVIVASQLATLLNVRLISIESLMQPKHAAWRPNTSKPLPPVGAGPVLIVDDSCWSGGTLREVRNALPEHVRKGCLFGAVYVNAESVSQIDCHAVALDSLQHCFGWNYLRDMHAHTTLTDMDGVLCDDWRGDVNDEDAIAYELFLRSATPRVRPVYPVLGVVTGRVETHRAATEDWLRRHGVGYQSLVMPFASAAVRRGVCVGTAKARVYEAESRATLFVESDVVQARVIFEQTGKPVFCSDTLEMFQ